MLLARKNRSEKPPSRPGSAVKDNLSRKVLYGKQAVRSHGPLSEFTDEGQVERGKVRNPTDVPLIGGFPHGFGSKTYDVKHEWGAHVLPFGPIMNKLNHVRPLRVPCSHETDFILPPDQHRPAGVLPVSLRELVTDGWR